MIIIFFHTFVSSLFMHIQFFFFFFNNIQLLVRATFSVCTLLDPTRYNWHHQVRIQSQPKSILVNLTSFYPCLSPYQIPPCTPHKYEVQQPLPLPKQGTNRKETLNYDIMLPIICKEIIKRKFLSCPSFSEFWGRESRAVQA